MRQLQSGVANTALSSQAPTEEVEETPRDYHEPAPDILDGKIHQRGILQSTNYSMSLQRQRLHPCILSDVRESRYHNLQTQTILRQWHSLWENGSAVGALETSGHVLFGVKYSNPQIPSQGQLQTLFWDSPHGVQWHKSQPQCLGAVVPYVIHLWPCGEKCRFAKIKIKDFLHSRD